jgi:RHS repeat-associated protein
VSQTRTHAAAHELTGLTTGGTTSPLSYDPKGNLLSRPAALASPALGLVWDFDNRLRGADTNGTPATQEVTFEYDALGRRVARSETGNNVVYVHAGQQVIADYARGAATAAPSFRYVYGSYVDEPLLRHAGTGTTLPTSGTAALYYHRNQQYSIVGLSDAAGALVERYAYTAYGELTILAPDRTLRTTSSFQNRYTYTGREWDAGLSLYYFRARWLEPKAGRFIGRDPLGYVDGMGLYGAYFAVRGVDPTGYTICKCSEKRFEASDSRFGASITTRTYFKYTPGKCQKLNEQGAYVSRTCDNDPVTGSMTIDEWETARICSGNPICEEAIAKLMNKVQGTTSGVPSPYYVYLDERAYCFNFLERFRKHNYNWNDENKALLDGGCTVELLEVMAHQKLFDPYWKTVVTARNRLGMVWGFKHHGIARVCCGPEGKKKCMFFDVGIESYTGQFGGADKWFSFDDEDFQATIDTRPGFDLPWIPGAD